MGKILEVFVEDKLYVTPSNEIRSSRQQKLCNKICERIGICKVDADGNIVELQREYFSQGWVFKDWTAFQNHPDAPLLCSGVR